VASYLSVQIPYTEAFIDGRWIFGFIGFAILDHWWAALLLACFLSITRPAGLSVGTAFVGNMLYALPSLVVIRGIYRRVLARWRSLLGTGLAWLSMILFCYQAFVTPVVWGVIAFLENRPIWAGMLQGWRDQPYFIESLLVGIISALAMIVSRSNAALRASRRELEHVLVTVPEGVLVLDARGKVLLANPVAERYLEILSTRQQGEAITYLGDDALENLLTSPPQGLWHEIEAGTRTFDVIARPIANGPDPEQWVLVLRDVTEERMVRRRTALQERLASVGQLAAGIAHDFNNLISVIAIYAQMGARDAGLPARHQEQSSIILEQTRYAADLVQQVLDFSRRATLDRRPVDLLVFIKEQVKLLERTIPEHIDIHLNYGREPYFINADPTRMQQVMMNLAVNARDAMPDGGRLSVELAQIQVEDPKKAPLPGMETGDWVRLTVADTGVGIPEDVLPRVFEPFFTTKRVGEGSGLGLSQVWGIVKQHDGFIDVESREGSGTTLTLYLPALKTRQPDDLDVPAEDLPRGAGEMILLVEDNAALREALRKSLTSLNYRILESTNGHEALDVLKRQAGDVALVLSDLVMPRMGGEALFYALKEKYPEIPMILLTGHPMEEELKEMEAHGLGRHLLKPPDTEELAWAVAELLGRDIG
jgi:signal transduction histidine kinase/CheY-like chemotaxis protein